MCIRDRLSWHRITCCNDSPSLGSAVISFWPNPKKFYKWYKSAEVHTKQSFKLPLWLFIPLIGIAIDIYFVPMAYAVLSHGISGKGIRLALIIILPCLSIIRIMYSTSRRQPFVCAGLSLSPVRNWTVQL